MALLDRRSFLRSAAAGAAALGAPRFLSAAARRDPLRVALIGVGGIGNAHRGAMEQLGQKIAFLCDVDLTRVADAAKKHPDAVVLQDYRKLFDQHRSEIDAVFVGTPDHHHYPATKIALDLGIHAYTQKPLTQTVGEARRLAEAAAKSRAATQMGNQGHANDHWRRLIELVRSGNLGAIVETHTWTNRPVWPQGIGRPAGEDAIPAQLDWDVWCGPAPKRPYKSGAYHAFAWRGWWDFGAGALGDMACHTMDGVFWALEPGHCESVEPLVVEEMTDETFPKRSKLRWRFAKNAWRPAFDAYWYDGGLRPEIPAALGDAKIPNTGNLLIFEKAVVMMGGDYGSDMSVFPTKQGSEIATPPQSLPSSPGHYEEFLLACRGEGKALSNFAYAGPMCETILLGNVAVRLGQKLEWDGPAMKVKNVDEANEFLWREPREGWRV
jgi:predicted dehydrogenase